MTFELVLCENKEDIFYIEVFVIRNYCVVREYRQSPECGKCPPSDRNYILTVYDIIGRV